MTRTTRHNLKLSATHRTRFDGRGAFDEQLASLLDGIDAFASTHSHSHSPESIEALVARATAELPRAQAKWTVWVDGALKDRFHAAKAKYAPVGATHALFTELLLAVRDVAVLSSDCPATTELAPSQRKRSMQSKQPFITAVSSIAQSLFNSSPLSSISKRRSVASLKSKASSPAAELPLSRSSSPSLAIKSEVSESRRAFEFPNRTLSEDSSSTTTSFNDVMDNETVKEEANDDIYSTMSQNDYRDVDAVSESSISSISAYSSDEMESEHPKEKEEYEYEAYYGQEQQFDDEKKELDDRDCKLEMLGAVNQFEHAAQPIPYSCYYQPNVSTLPPLPLQQQYVSSAPSYFSSSDFAAIPPPNYPFSYDTKADSQAIHDMKLQQEYLWQWQHENGSSPSSQLSFPSFWDEEVDPETLVQIQQQYNAQLKQQEHEYYAYKQHLRNGAGTSQYLPVLGQHNQQPENEPLPPYLGIMSPLSAPLASLSLEPSTSSPRQQQPHQHQGTSSSEELPYDTYLTHISDSPSFAPMQMDESGMGGSPLFSGTVGSILLEDINRALEVLPPPAYHRGSEELEEVMDLEMELEGFAGFQ